jgi:hypothetical protein
MTLFETIDPNQPLIKLTVGQLSELLAEQLLATCPIADFTGIGPGHIVYSMTIADVRFDLFPQGRTEAMTLPGDTVERSYLGLFGTGEVRITLPIDAKRIDVFAANVGGHPLQFLYYDSNYNPIAVNPPPPPLDPTDKVTRVTAIGSGLRIVRILVDSAECLIWRVRYCAA